MSDAKVFYATSDGFIEGTWQYKGDKIPMTEKQAKYYIMAGSLSKENPLKDVVKNPAPETAKKPASTKLSKDDKGE